MSVARLPGAALQAPASAPPHGDPLHLIFNLMWLWLFGTLVEEVYGHLRTLAILALLEAGDDRAEYAFFRGGIGLSGITYGLFGLLFVLSRKDRRFINAVDARTTQFAVGWFFLCIATTVAGVWRVANVAHGVGALIGGCGARAPSAGSVGA